MTINWLTKEIQIPQSDWVLDSGTFYKYATNDSRIAMKVLEASEIGIVFPDTHKHNTEVTVAGTTYARTIEIINGYFVTFENIASSVQLEGSNNNMWDIGGGILTQNLVQIIPTNAAGLITVVSGSGVTEQDKLDIANRVWIYGSRGLTTFGSLILDVWNYATRLLTASPVTEQDKLDVADRVWDSELADHVADGTFGGELATKSDVRASAITNKSQAISGTVVEGINGNGSYLNTQVLDGSNWKIDEVAGFGITVEMTFNLPSVDHNPGILSVFGRYGGNPPEFHWQDLWFYNYQSASWELLKEEFMPGGFTSMATYQHEYYERHVDRTNNSEVKIRLIHSVATYNPAHSLRLDYVEVTSIEVVSAETIADAVWDKTLP